MSEQEYGDNQPIGFDMRGRESNSRLISFKGLASKVLVDLLLVILNLMVMYGIFHSFIWNDVFFIVRLDSLTKDWFK